MTGYARIGWSVLLSAMTVGDPTNVAAQDSPVSAPTGPGAPPHVMAQQLFFADKLPELDPLVADLVEKDARDEDGLPVLMMVTDFVGYAAVPPSGEGLDAARQRVHAWMKADPGSAFAPIVEAKRLQRMAWRARGSGYSSEVTPEGWEIFREQSQAAWKVLMGARKQSSRIPGWYSLAIDTGRDGGIPLDQITAIFEEGSKRFPTYYDIYFAYLQNLAPRWGGDYGLAKAFILAQTDGRANREGDALYTRLYWSLDGSQGNPVDFFETSQADWPRMRRGFELLLSRYPGSTKNLTVFGAFACRAHDRETYEKLRPRLTGDNFRDFVRPRYTLEVCDRRFAAKGN